MSDAARSGLVNGKPARRPVKRDLNGILLLDKPVGQTSNRSLQIVKRLYQARKAGHTGSLDPLASGLLPLCFGQATKVSHWLLDADKIYEVELAIGSRTDTADADGQVVEQAALTSVSLEALQAAIALHLGELDQVPPMYSALKQDGQRLYKLARQGQEVERKARRITIYALDIVRFDPVCPVLRVHCSKGTYIRTLVETLAEAMGTLAHVAMLRRLELGPFRGDAMITMEMLEQCDGDIAQLDEFLLSADVALQDMPRVELTEDEAFYLKNGHAVGHAAPELSGNVRVYDDKQQFLAVGQIEPDGRIAPKRLFVNTNAESNPT